MEQLATGNLYMAQQLQHISFFFIFKTLVLIESHLNIGGVGGSFNLPGVPRVGSFHQ